MQVTSSSMLKKNTRLHITKIAGTVTKIWEVRQSDLKNSPYLCTHILQPQRNSLKMGAGPNSSCSFLQLYILPSGLLSEVYDLSGDSRRGTSSSAIVLRGKSTVSLRLWTGVKLVEDLYNISKSKVLLTSEKWVSSTAPIITIKNLLRQLTISRLHRN